MGESVNEGTIIKWHKKIGDFVKRDEIIFEISTDKVDTEIPSPSDGILTEIFVQEGQTVEVGTVVAKIQSQSEENSNSDISNKLESQNFEKVETPTDNIDLTDIIEIKMPKMGESVMDGTIIKWHKKIGDFVKKDEIIFEISTDKVDTEIPSPEDGFLIEILVEEKKTVEVGTVVAKLSTKKKIEKIDSSLKQVNLTSSESLSQSSVSMQDNFSKNVDFNEIHKTERTRFYSPLVISIAEKEKIPLNELESIKGTGLDGRVTKKDLLDYISKKKKTHTEETIQVPKTTVVSDDNISIKSQETFIPSSIDHQIIPMDNIRSKIMEHMIHSRDTSVHVTGMIEVDVTRIKNFIDQNKERFLKTENVKLTYMAFIADAVIKALKKYPLLNSSIDGNKIIQKRTINLGIAVAIEPAGLIVPNIKNAGDKNLVGLAKSIQDLATRSRTKKLTPDDISFGTFTITNYGVFGTLWGTPIINQPEVAILGVGAVRKIPVVLEIDNSDTIAIRNIMALTLSHDHRLIDGMLGGLFLQELKNYLENFDFNKI